ncbi:MAG: TatD family hydrolase [Patescibacteria group bacterium]
MPRLIDSHCHLHFPAYDEDREAVLSRLKETDTWAVTVGTTLGTSKGAVAFAEATDGVWATVGYHPEHFTSAYHDEAEGDAGEYSIEEIAKVARSSKKVVAIGETGLDFYRIDEGRNRDEAIAQQEKGFREHIALAKELNLPVVIHCREALARLAEIVRAEKEKGWNGRAVVHCYTGTWEEAQPLLDLGLYLSFTGIITFPPKKTDDPERHVHRVIERMPIDRILVETDAPWLTPVPFRGKRNEPSYVQYVAEQIAMLRNVTVGEIAEQTTENARKLFGI